MDTSTPPQIVARRGQQILTHLEQKLGNPSRLQPTAPNSLQLLVMNTSTPPQTVVLHGYKKHLTLQDIGIPSHPQLMAPNWRQLKTVDICIVT
jgi:hypothetical protein